MIPAVKCEGARRCRDGKRTSRSHLETLAPRPGAPHGRGRAQLVSLCAPTRARGAFIWYDPAVEDSELVPLDDADWSSDLAAWNAECAASRAAASARSLDDTGLRFGEPCSLRWIYVHMIEEYARHNGHADLIRELIDESVGC